MQHNYQWENIGQKESAAPLDVSEQDHRRFPARPGPVVVISSGEDAGSGTSVVWERRGRLERDA